MCGILFAMFVELCSVSGLEPREKKLTESPDLRRGNLQKSKYFLVHRPYVLSIDNFLGNNQRKNLHLLIEMNPPLKFLKSFATCSPCVNVLPKLFIFDETLFEFRYSNFFPRNKVSVTFSRGTKSYCQHEDVTWSKWSISRNGYVSWTSMLRSTDFLKLPTHQVIR